MAITVEARPKKYFHFHMRSWMWGFLFGGVWSLMYLGAAGVFGPVPPSPVDVATSQFAITPANSFFFLVMLPLLKLLIIPPTKKIFLGIGVAFILFVWSFLFHLAFPATKHKLIAVSSLLIGYIVMVRVLEISPTICIPCLQASTVEWDPGWFLR